ncbi:MAG: cysteine-rich CWC family protein [Burkholderiaceae bacterium]
MTAQATAPSPLPAGWRTTGCPRCGEAFACGAGADRATPCSCAGIELTPQRRAELAARYDDCLCAACLAALAADPGLAA